MPPYGTPDLWHTRARFLFQNKAYFDTVQNVQRLPMTQKTINRPALDRNHSSVSGTFYVVATYVQYHTTCIYTCRIQGTPGLNPLVLYYIMHMLHVLTPPPPASACYEMDTIMTCMHTFNYRSS
jgi:hypothetical protein